MTPLPSYGWRLAHLTALWAYGVSQPVFSMLDANPEFLVVRGSTRADVLVFASILTLIVPMVVVAAEALASSVSEMLAEALHIVAIWCFAFLALLQIVRLLDPERRAALLLPMLPAALVALAYMKWRPFRSFLSISVVLPVLGLLGFVATVPLAVDDARGADVAVATQTPIVLVVFDEFPLSSLMRADGTLDRRRYPNFAQLADDSVWYPRATTSHASTTHAVPAILTGRLPRRDALPTLADHPDNLFTLLGESYAIRALEQATRLCPSRYCPRTRGAVPVVDRQRGLFYDVSIGYLHRILPRSLRGGLPTIGERWGGFGDPSEVDIRELVLGALDASAWDAALAKARGRKREQFEEFVESLGGTSQRPVLFFEHALLPHSPWAFLPSGRTYGDADVVEGVESDWIHWRPSQRLVHQALQRHLLQVGYVDRIVGQLITRLRSTGLYDKALVVVTADHGASFRPNGYLREVDGNDLADIAAVPLFVRYPGQHVGRVDRRDAKTIDIVPTIADVIGARIPWHVDGRSLRARGQARPVAVSGVRTGEVTATSRVIAEGVLATARRNAALFGSGTDSLYRLGPYDGLLGRPVPTGVSTPAAGARVQLDDEFQFANVRAASRFVPARIVGEIEDASLPPGSPIALAIDDRVVATTWSFELGGRHRFAVMVPESSFHEGRNAVTLFSISNASGAVRLTPLGGTRRAPASGATG